MQTRALGRRPRVDPAGTAPRCGPPPPAPVARGTRRYWGESRRRSCCARERRRAPDFQPRARQLTPAARLEACVFSLTPSSVSGLRVSRGAFPLAVLGFLALVAARRRLAGPGSSNPLHAGGLRRLPHEGRRLRRALVPPASSAGLRLPGRQRGWYRVSNVSVTPYTYTEDFAGDEARAEPRQLDDRRPRVHTVWRVDDWPASRSFMERFSTTSPIAGTTSAPPDAIVKVGVSELRARTAAHVRAATRCSGATGSSIKEALRPANWRTPCWPASAPIRAGSSVVHCHAASSSATCNTPRRVSAAVSRKLAATQELQRKDTEIEIEQKERTEARGAGAGHRQRHAHHSRPTELRCTSSTKRSKPRRTWSTRPTTRSSTFPWAPTRRADHGHVPDTQEALKYAGGR